MHLFELANPDPIITSLVAVSDQLKSDIDSGERDPKMSVDELLDYFQKYDLTLDRNDLYKMIKKPPLKSVISNIKGDEVVFKGHSEPEEPTDSQNQKIVKQMATNAAKKLN